MSDEVSAQIDAARRTGASHLDLSGLDLRTLPDTLGNLTALTTLDLNGNQLTALPLSFALLQPEALRLGGNPLAPEVLAAFEDSAAELGRLLGLLRSEGCADL